MSTVVLIGAQWGDEGKGKVTDFLAEKADIIVRFQGGNNAGHTVVVDDNEFKLQLLPSGILYPDKLCIIGNGVVVDPAVLKRELDSFVQRGISRAKILISDRAHVIMPYHQKLDEVEEEHKGNAKIGTTKKGIGPAYMDKASRDGIRMVDLVDADDFKSKLQYNVTRKNEVLEKIYGVSGQSYDEIYNAYSEYIDLLKPMVSDTSAVLNEAIGNGKNILFEGAQGTLLDLDHGTYPYVTSSHPTASAACLGSGIGPTRVDRVIGIAKAYTTRVGEGPFPTELFDALGDQIRNKGREFGTVTGRPRRCGWFDAVIVGYAGRISGLDSLALTKLDILTGLPEVKICIGYRYQDQIITDFPASLRKLAQCEPVYETLPGWQEDLSGARSLSDLPVNARRYVERIEQLTGVKVALIGVGVKRTQTIIIENLYK